MAEIVKLLGDSVASKAGPVAVADLAVDGGVVGLYFSAHWCPPCKGFTPKLAAWYDVIKKTENGAKFDIVFVSSDRSEEDFNGYFADMPWLALPYEKRTEKAKLSKKFKVDGIPTLVFLDSTTGSVINKNGRNIVTDDPTGSNFPWASKTVADMLKGQVLQKDGEEVVEVDLADAIKGKVIGIYFSAHWCGPCRAFTPKLVESYNKIKELGKNFEIIFASSDSDEDSFTDYYKTMPWLALPHEDKRKDELDGFFEVNGIPTLVILDENFKVITDEGRGAIMSDPEGAKFPWIPPPLQELTQVNASKLNDQVCLIYLTDKKPEYIAKAKELLQEVAEETLANQAEDDDPILICYESEETGELAQRLRDFVKITKEAPCLVCLNIGAQEKHICEDSDNLSKENIKDIISQVRSECLEWCGLSD